MRKRLAALGAATTATIAVASPALAVTTDSYESSTMSQTNYHRTYHDLHKVTRGTCVDKWAEKQARLMRDKQTLYHQSLSVVLKDCKLKAAAENIAEGYSSGKAVVTAWMSSPGHRANILTSGYRLIGVGAVKDSHGTWWVSQVFGTAK